MDIHRCRFVPYPSSAINALAFSHPSSTAAKGKGPPTLRLAVGRANGDIEIWNPLKGAWHQESILPGGKDRSVEGLVWTQEPGDIDRNGFKTPGKLRLFSIGYSTAVTEWDLASGRPARHYSSNYGELWCIAAQPSEHVDKQTTSEVYNTVIQEAEPQYQSIAVGCADGAIVLLSTADNDLQLQKILARPSSKRARVLSVAFQSRNVVVAGYADSVIRVFDTRNGQQIRQMSLGAGPAGGPKEILVWSVRCLYNGTIASGDSTGTIRFWDGKNYALLQRLKSHTADILDIAASADGETVISGGMDRRTVVYRRTDSGKASEQRRRWVEVAHQRMHSHDVKAMATFESRQLSILASGGLDTKPIIIPLQEFGREHHRSLSNLPQSPPICSAPKRRLIMSWWLREISVWRVCKTQRSQDDSDGNTDSVEFGPRKLVAKIALKGEESLTSADLSSDGSMIAASTTSETKIFRLRQKTNSALRVQRIEIPPRMNRYGARMVHFSPDGRWLVIITADNLVQLFRITGNEAVSKAPQLLPKPVELRRLPRETAKPNFQHGSLGNYNRLISRVAFSEDSRILATGDLTGYLDTWVLEGYEDLTQPNNVNVDEVDSSASSDDEDNDEEQHPTVIFGQHWIRNPAAPLIPKLAAAPIILSFRPSNRPLIVKLANGTTPTIHPTRQTPCPHSHDLPNGEDRLFAMTSEHQIYEFEVLSGRISNWSRRNPTSHLPGDFRAIRDRATGLIWDIRTDLERIWLYGSSWLWMFDLSKDFPRPKEPLQEPQQEPKGDDVATGSNSKNKRKRKREAKDAPKVVLEPGKQDSGAGNKIPPSELGVGIGRRFRRTDGPELDSSRWISLDQEYSADSDDDDDNKVGGSALLDMRRGTAEAGEPSNGVEEDAVSTQGGVNASRDTKPNKRPINSDVPYWCTYKYRPILGIVPLGGGNEGEDQDAELDGDDDELAKGVEVALVERPPWELDLPPRYHGDQEWNN